METLHQAVINFCKFKEKCSSGVTLCDVWQQVSGAGKATELLCSGSEWQELEVAHWLRFAALHIGGDRPGWTEQLEAATAHVTFLVGGRLTLADVCVWAQLKASPQWAAAGGEKWPNLRRYFSSIGTVVEKDVGRVAVRKATAEQSARFEEGGKFKELSGASSGPVVVRFPPEASGYLHIGHAKAALLNQHYRDTYNGRLILRFDDTNPAKETEEFENVIQEDLELLGVKYDQLSHTSDHFDTMLQLCERLIREGRAYVDDTEPEAMKQQREARTESANRNNSVDKNLRMWQEMQSGSQYGHTCCVRAKVDMQSDNGCMRDPTIYRCKSERHIRTGDKYNVYPTYDFACPIVDSLEGVTHALRTLEYKDRDAQYYWFIEALGLRRPELEEFSRLALQHTVLSKRKLTWFVNEGLVDGWGDPRFPTVRGIMRRGMTIEGLRQFILAQGFAKSNATMEWDKIWAFNKKVIDPVAPRYTALLRRAAVPVRVLNFAHAQPQQQEVPLHPKDPSVGTKVVRQWREVLVEGADAEAFSEGELVTFINWGNLRVRRLVRGADGRVQEVEAELELDNKDFKKTQKVTWLAREPERLVPVVCLHCEPLISKPIVGKDEDFRQFVNKASMRKEAMLGDEGLRRLRRGDIVQLQRRGFFVCDQPAGVSQFSDAEMPCFLVAIPDGHQKEMPTSGSKHKEPAAAKAATSSKKPKQQKQQQAPAGAGLSQHVDLLTRIAAQGDAVRELKAKKAEQASVKSEIDKLLALKAEFKAASGKDWKPEMLQQLQDTAGQQQQQQQQQQQPNSRQQQLQEIKDQGDSVRSLKGAKADKAQVQAAVDKLLQLKAKFKADFNEEWSPKLVDQQQQQQQQQQPQQQQGSSAGRQELLLSIKAQGDAVRACKSEKKDKATVKAEVDKLLALKAEFKAKFGEEWKPELLEAAGGGGGGGGAAAAAAGADAETQKLRSIKEVGDRIRSLKAGGADKATLQPEIQRLQALKVEFKQLTGDEYKPEMLQRLD